MTRAFALRNLAAAALIFVGFYMVPIGLDAASKPEPPAPTPLPILRGGVAEERPKVAKLKFSVSPIRCVKACQVTLKAVVDAPPDLCVTGVRWITDRDGCQTKDNAKGCYHEYQTECSERRFSMWQRYEPGRYFVSVEILSDNTKLPAQGMWIDVGDLER
jgi:hypothetical protein